MLTLVGMLGVGFASGRPASGPRSLPNFGKAKLIRKESREGPFSGIGDAIEVRPYSLSHRYPRLQVLVQVTYSGFRVDGTDPKMS